MEEAKRYDELFKQLQEESDGEGEGELEDISEEGGSGEDEEEEDWESCSSDEDTDTASPLKDPQKSGQVQQSYSKESDGEGGQSDGGRRSSEAGQCAECSGDEVQNSWVLLTSEGLVALLKSLHEGRRHGDVLTIGMVRVKSWTRQVFVDL